MKIRNLQNKNLNLLGRKMLDAAKVKGDEIENIVNSPRLFDAIKARIENEPRALKSENIPVAVWSGFQFRNWQRVAFFPVVLLFFISALIGIGFINFNKLEIEQTAVPDVEIQMKIENPIIGPVIEAKPPKIFTVVDDKNKSLKFAKTTVSANKTLRSEKTVAKAAQKRKFENKPKPSPLKFYALNGNPVEPGEEMQIVRTELSRTALFALGVNLPIENETEKLKTDLLVGSDGVARAIRIVD